VSDLTALYLYAAVVWLAFCGSIAFPRSSPVTRGSMRLLAVSFAVLVVESYRVEL
jgi:hypothetical protein